MFKHNVKIINLIFQNLYLIAFVIIYNSIFHIYAISIGVYSVGAQGVHTPAQRLYIPANAFPL